MPLSLPLALEYHPPSKPRFAFGKQVCDGMDESFQNKCGDNLFKWIQCQMLNNFYATTSMRLEKLRKFIYLFFCD